MNCRDVLLSYKSKRKSSRLKNQKKHRYNQRKMEKNRKMKVHSFFYTFDDSLILSMIVPDTYSCGKNRQSG